MSTADKSDDRRRGAAELFEAFIRYFACRFLLRHPDDPLLQSMCGRDVGRRPLGNVVTRIGEEIKDAFGRSGNADLPLVVVCRAFGLSPLELDLLVLAVLPELDDRFGDLFQRINRAAAAAGGRRLTVAMALRYLLPDGFDRTRARDRLGNSVLWSAGLLRPAYVDQESIPLFERTLVATPALAAGIGGRLPESLDGGAPVTARDPGDDTQLALAFKLRPAFKSKATALADWARSSPGGIVHMPTDVTECARGFADAVVHALDARAVMIRPAGPEVAAVYAEAALCALSQADTLKRKDGELLMREQRDVLLVEIDRTVEAVSIPDGPRPPTLTVLITGARCRVDLPAARPARRVDPPMPTPLEQAGYWRHFLGDVKAAAHVDMLANQTHLGVDQIEKTVKLAKLHLHNERRRELRRQDLIRALGEVVPAPSSHLAVTRRPSVRWSQLVLDRRVKVRLEDVVRRVRDRVTVKDRWGLSGIGGRGDGIVALLHGESGTGKTMAAEAIATQLCLPVLSVDLSQVMSEYIGDTEKHLSDLFALAEGFRAILFFDEADALFGKRTSVRDAHDRFANVEVNYILQRVEMLEGICILATNLLKNVDEAFSRRMQAVVHLPRPTPPHQLAIWDRHLPERIRGRDIDLKAVARQSDLVGGDIRSAALTAAYAAAARGGKVTSTLLLDAIRQELLKRGRPMPARLNLGLRLAVWRQHLDGLMLEDEVLACVVGTLDLKPGEIGGVAERLKAESEKEAGEVEGDALVDAVEEALAVTGRQLPPDVKGTLDRCRPAPAKQRRADHA